MEQCFLIFGRVKRGKAGGWLGEDDVFDSRETICGVDEEFFKVIHLMVNDLGYFLKINYTFIPQKISKNYYNNYHSIVWVYYLHDSFLLFYSIWVLSAFNPFFNYKGW